jgi:hypothetical protein
MMPGRDVALLEHICQALPPAGLAHHLTQVLDVGALLEPMPSSELGVACGHTADHVGDRRAVAEPLVHVGEATRSSILRVARPLPKFSGFSGRYG